MHRLQRANTSSLHEGSDEAPRNQTIVLKRQRRTDTAIVHAMLLCINGPPCSEKIAKRQDWLRHHIAESDTFLQDEGYDAQRS